MQTIVREIKSDSVTLEYLFTEDELTNPLTLDVLKEYNAEESEEYGAYIVSVNPDEVKYDALIDEIRERLCGDVVAPDVEVKEVVVTPALVDGKGKVLQEAVTKMVERPVEKDLSKCPCLSLSMVSKAEAVEEAVEEPIKEELEVKADPEFVKLLEEFK